MKAGYRRFLVSLAAAVVLAGGVASELPGDAGAPLSLGRGPYEWPIKPFNRQHAVSAFFGDPRTIFVGPLRNGDAIGAAFHNGIDIPARAGTPVYAVVGGLVHLPSGSEVVVFSPDERTFQYQHVKPAVVEGQYVAAHSTLLGRVDGWAGHLHFAEITGFRPRNPLAPGHLEPYRDTTRPHVVSVSFRTPDGDLLSPARLFDRVDIVVRAYDPPPFPRFGARVLLPVTPAALLWSVTRPDGQVVLHQRAGPDFRRTIPHNAEFWRVYARGTYQNHVVFGGHAHIHLAGRYLFHLVPDFFNTGGLPDGTYILNVTAIDTGGNRSKPLHVRFTIANHS
ncbi:MAG TPA: M23 family metallopeptidase [Gaiellaceae bacterium]